MGEHLEHRQRIDEHTRDRLRDELGGYAWDAILCDGVSVGTHQTILNNNPYDIVHPNTLRKATEDNPEEYDKLIIN